MAKFKGNEMNILGTPIKVGEKLKDVTLTTNAFEPIKLSEVINHQVAILSIAPSLDTSVCDLQAKGLIARLPENVKLITITVDLPPAQARWCSANGTNSITLSDHKDLEFGMNYGFVIEELRLLRRGIVLVDSEGIIRFVDYLDEITDQIDFDKVFSEVDKLI